MTIPIQNIYYLLCYAWDKLDERALVSVSTTEAPSLLDLLTRVLVNGTHRLFRQGLAQQYHPQQEALSTIRGRINFTESLRTNEFWHGRAVCELDELTNNHAANQILKSTLRALLRIQTLTLRTSVQSLYRRMNGIDECRLTDSVFHHVNVPRHPNTYGFILNICELLHKNLLVTEEEGSYQFREFWRDEKQMATLFEAFVRNFYRYELPDWKVRRETIYWKLEASDTDRSLLPQMQTDLTLEKNQQKIIIDTKYYTETFQRRFQVSKIHSPHLYQLFAYLKNTSPTPSLTGILLYPTVTKSVSATFTDDTHRIRVHTLNLNQHWSLIHQDLLKLIP